MHPVVPRSSLLRLSILVAAASLAACASPGTPPTSQLADARTSLAQAESTGAREAAPVELAAARDKLAKADEAVKAEHYPMARRLSEEAQVDAELADRRTRAARAKAAADALAQSNQLLREELNRQAPR